MTRSALWLLLVSASLSCGAPHGSQTPRPAPPAAASASAIAVTDSSPVSPAERELSKRGLKRRDARAAVPPPNWDETRASLYILARTRDGQVALVGSGAQLYTGEQIELHVSVGRPSYVYLIQISPNEQTTILYPAEGESDRMLPGTDYRMPTNPDVRFVLDEHVGTERMAFIVTERPLATGDAEVRMLIDQLRATGRWAADDDGAATNKTATGGAPAKQGARAGTVAQAGPIHGAGSRRGFVRTTNGTGRALDVQPDRAGVALAIFTFNHVP